MGYAVLSPRYSRAIHVFEVEVRVLVYTGISFTLNSLGCWRTPEEAFNVHKMHYCSIYCFSKFLFDCNCAPFPLTTATISFSILDSAQLTPDISSETENYNFCPRFFLYLNLGSTRRE